MTELFVRLDRIVECAPEVAWAFIVEHFFDNHGRWDPAVIGMEQLTPGPVAAGTKGVETRRFLGRQKAAFEITEVREPAMFAFRNTSGPFALDRSYRLQPTDAGTKLTFTFRMSPKAPAAIVFPLVRRTIERQVRANIDRLCQLLKGQ
jgi:hypothetical protein